MSTFRKAPDEIRKMADGLIRRFDTHAPLLEAEVKRYIERIQKRGWSYP